MAKIKTSTPQEIYRARKEREEEERESLLPPGLVNHGNTCFMNSVLQGLIATPLLVQLVLSTTQDPAIASRRSPQLTNGHGLGGPDEKEWIDSMPLGDAFIGLMRKAWDVQQSHKRETMSPKLILSTLGKKYDQYLDFAQQDAHEFLRQLLDAMRMEEFDVIKRRQRPKHSPRRDTLMPGDMLSDDKPLPLVSFADMLFGGRLTSILVCQKCKHVSQTYEDFNDLSLSIRADDPFEKKKNPFKSLAKKFKLGSATPTTTTNVNDTPAFNNNTNLSVGLLLEQHRASSVPPSPRFEREEIQLAGDPPVNDDPRRRSFDQVVQVATDQARDLSESQEFVDIGQADLTPSAGDAPLPVPAKTLPSTRIEFIEPDKKETPDKKESAKRAQDSWSKMGRRLSLGAKGIGRSLSTAKEKEREKRGRSGERPDTPVSKTFPTGASSSRTSVSSDKFVLVDDPKQKEPPLKRAKSPRPPKPSAAETEYIRQILADITPTTAVTHNPFAMFKQTYSSTSIASANSTSAENSHTPWSLKLPQFTGVEECLRMFTSVEILDGDNMVGCRRCWKIANGVYVPPTKTEERRGKDDSDSDPAEENGDIDNDFDVIRQPALHIHLPPNKVDASMSSPTLSMYKQANKSGDDISLSTFTTFASESQVTLAAQRSIADSDTSLESSPEQRPMTPGGLPIPLISTTAPPDSPVTTPLAVQPKPWHQITDFNVLTNAASISLPPSPEPKDRKRNSLQTPAVWVRHKDGNSSAESSDDESEGFTSGLDTDTSTTSPSKPSTRHAPRTAAQKAARAKEVIMRPAYKRYLIDTPPPILVIHLKRFQHASKTPIISFSSGFKKLEDYVAFPETLDLGPFLAPKKEDFGLGRKGKQLRKEVTKSLGRGREQCLYRLYAVVVHIGNMLGGHYIAYTALPPRNPTPSAAPQPKQWAYISDTVVRLTTLEEVLKAKAYLCMYERV